MNIQLGIIWISVEKLITTINDITARAAFVSTGLASNFSLSPNMYWHITIAITSDMMPTNGVPWKL